MIALDRSDQYQLHNSSRRGYKCIEPHCLQKTIYPPACALHMKLIYGVEIKTTTLVDSDLIPYRFLGVFATRDFKRGDFVVPYLGELLNKQTICAKYGSTEDTVAPYVLEIEDDMYVDAMNIRGVGGMLNMCQAHDTDRSLDKHISNNTHFRVVKGFYPFIKACKKIRAGDELFIHYGDTYFKN